MGRIEEERERSDTPSHEGGEREKKKKIKNGWRKKRGKKTKHSLHIDRESEVKPEAKAQSIYIIGGCVYVRNEEGENNVHPTY